MSISIDEIEEYLSRFIDPILLDSIDLHETVKFIQFLPRISEREGYLVQMMIRPKGIEWIPLKERVIQQKVVHGYHSWRDPVIGWEYWRTRMLGTIINMYAIVRHGFIDFVERSGDGEVTGIHPVPKLSLVIMVMVNPSNVLRASIDTVNNVVSSVYSVLEENDIHRFRRPDIEYYSSVARRHRTVFHEVDIDDPDLVTRVAESMKKTMKEIPPFITTPNGVHFLVRIDEPGWVTGETDKLPRDVLRTYRELSSICKPGRDEKCIDKINDFIDTLLEMKEYPLFKRLSMISSLLTDEKGRTLLSLNKQGLEPVPGIPYRGTIPRIVTENTEEEIMGYVELLKRRKKETEVIENGNTGTKRHDLLSL